MKRVTRILVAGMAIASVPVLAHHSFAMFDSSKEVTLEGEVKEFQWANPHVWVQVMAPAPDGSGEIVEWSIEGSSPNGLVRRGWTRKSLQPGDKVTITIHPLRDGTAGGSLMKVIGADGKEVGGSRD